MTFIVKNYLLLDFPINIYHMYIHILSPHPLFQQNDHYDIKLNPPPTNRFSGK